MGNTSDFDLNADIPKAPKASTEAAVLVAFYSAPDGPRLVLTKRSSTLKAHPGQVAFPGGKRDLGDKTLQATALREAHEEIGLPPSQVDILGQLPNHTTVTGFDVTPIVGWVTGAWTPSLNPAEVSELFSVPADLVTARRNFRVESRQWAGQARFYYTVPYGPYYIWGASARMLRALADAIGEEHEGSR